MNMIGVDMELEDQTMKETTKMESNDQAVCQVIISLKRVHYLVRLINPKQTKLTKDC